MHLVSDIATALGGALHGDGTLWIGRALEPGLAASDDLAVALSPGFVAQLGQGAARAALLAEGTDITGLDLDAAIFVPRGRLAMAKLTQTLDPFGSSQQGQHPTAVVEPGAVIGANVSLGAFVVVAEGAEIGANCVIGSHSSIGKNATIGRDAIIGAGCRIAPNVTIGERVRLHANVVVGGDGFSFVTTEPAHVEVARKTLGEGAAPVLSDPSWHRIHSLGGVSVGDDVEVGSNSTIDAGTLRPTRIGNGTKIDNLVQVGHNAVVGENCLLCAQVGVAGSAVIGDRSVLGGKSGVADNTTIGCDVVIGGGSVVLSNVPDGRVMLGYPAVKMRNHVESYKALRRLPRLLSRLGGSKTGSKDGSE